MQSDPELDETADQSSDEQSDSEPEEYLDAIRLLRLGYGFVSFVTRLEEDRQDPERQLHPLVDQDPDTDSGFVNQDQDLEEPDLDEDSSSDSELNNEVRLLVLGMGFSRLLMPLERTSHVTFYQPHDLLLST